MFLQTLVSSLSCYTLVVPLLLVILTSSYAVPDVDTQAVDTGSCPTWHVFDNKTKECTCQSLKSLVMCSESTSTTAVSIPYGYCMTFDNVTKTTYVGKCLYTVFSRENGSLFTVLPTNPLELNQFMCSQWHRDGRLCSTCADNYGLSVANFLMKCVECNKSEGVGWLLFLILQLVPVTILFIIVITFRLSIAQPPMNAFVLHSQMSLALVFLQGARFQSPFVSDSLSGVFVTLRSIIHPLLGIWNLSFFASIEDLTRFCVSTRLDYHTFYFLTYITTIHVLLLIVVTFICIELHARNCRLIVCLWKPFFKCFVRCTRVWNSQLTVIHTFATFLLLSYTRLIILSYFILAFQHVHTLSHTLESKTVLLYDPSVEYFDTRHLPYALPNFIILLSFAISPAVVLALYQTKPFQKCLECLRIHRCVSLRLFVELFQGCYKDGTSGSYDLRFTASLYLFLRLSLLLSLILCGASDYVGCYPVVFFVIFLTTLLFIAVAQPYKDNRMNKVDITLLSMLVLSYGLTSSVAESRDTTVNAIVLSCVIVLVSIPQLVFYSYILYRLCCTLGKLQCCQSLLRKCYFYQAVISRNDISVCEISDAVCEELSVSRFHSSYEEDNSCRDRILSKTY